MFLFSENEMVLVGCMSLFWVGVLTVIVLLALALAVYFYNKIISLDKRVKNAWAQIDVQLKKRNDLVPNLVETVKGYMKHERTVMDNVSKARERMLGAKTTVEAAAASDMLTGALKTLFAIAENYPNLRASENFRLLQEQLDGIESKIAFARQFYNDGVMEYNIAVTTFPGMIFAGLMGKREGNHKFFEATEVERVVPKVKFE
jgi:LemA protein